MNEVAGMNIMNKFADSLGMPVVNLNIRMCLFVFAPEKQLVIGEFGLCFGLFIAWSEECICIKSDSLFLTKVVLKLHFMWFIAEKPGSHFAVRGVEVSIKSSKMRRSHEVFRQGG